MGALSSFNDEIDMKSDTKVTDLNLLTSVEQFLYEENELLDELRYDAWVEMFTPDAVYWVPSNSDKTDPMRHVSLIYDDVRRIRERIARADSGMFWSQDPPTRTTRLIGGVQVFAEDSGYRVLAKLVLVAVRRGETQTLSGTCRYQLVNLDGKLLIKRKEVVLAQNDLPQINLTFLI